MSTRSPRLATLAALVAATSLLAAGCAASPPQDPEDDTITIAVGSLPAEWNPAKGLWLSDGNFAGQALTSPLAFWRADGGSTPVLAEGYSLADDRRSMDIVLREGISFSDESVVDADAVIASLEYSLAEESTSVFKSAINDSLEPRFEAVDDLHIRVTFARPAFHPEYMYVDAIRLLLAMPILSPSGLADPEAASLEPMSVGPYLLDDVVPDVEMTLVRNPDYWDPASYPYDTVVLKVLADPTARLNALTSGQVDAAPITSQQADAAEDAGLQLQYGYPNYFALMIRDPENSTLEPLRDVRVRQAIMLAFDRQAIADTIDNGYGRVSSQTFIEGQAGYVEGGDERYGYDPERARELLADAGFPDGFDLVLPQDGGNASLEPIVVQSLADIGIRVTLEATADGFEYFKAITGGKYPVYLTMGFNVNTLRILDEEFAGFGRFFDQNDRVDRLIAAIKQGDPEESADASAELGRLLLDEAWGYLPISRPPVMWATASGYAVETNDELGPGYWLYEFHPGES